jgi:hypothetical protein
MMITGHGLHFAFLRITRKTTWLRLSQRDKAWQTAEILILRHQLAALQWRQPQVPHLNWADRALLAALLSAMPIARRQELRLPVTPDTILRWHRDIARRRWAVRSRRGRTGRPSLQPAENDGCSPHPVAAWAVAVRCWHRDDGLPGQRCEGYRG